jgi:hypothetical protein
MKLGAKQVLESTTYFEDLFIFTIITLNQTLESTNRLFFYWCTAHLMQCR